MFSESIQDLPRYISLSFSTKTTNFTSRQELCVQLFSQHHVSEQCLIRLIGMECNSTPDLIIILNNSTIFLQ